MGMVNEGGTLNAGYNLEAARELILSPVFESESVLGRASNALGFPIYDVGYGVKEKRKFKRIGKMGPVAKARTNCSTWDPVVIQTSVDSEFSVHAFEVEAELCADEFVGIWENIRGAGSNMNSTEGELAAQLETALITRIRGAMKDDIFRQVWFAETAFTTTHSTGLAKLDMRTRSVLNTQMAQFNGFWPQIETAVTASNIAYVDSYNGTTRYATSANIKAWFEAMLDGASDELRAFVDEGRAVFLVQRAFFKAYREYLQGLGTEEANRFIVEGSNFRSTVLMYDGIPVIVTPEWDNFDKFLDVAGGKYKERGLLVAAENLQIGTDSSSSAGTEHGLLIYQDPQPSAKGKTEMYAAYRLGCGIAYNNLIVASYNGTTLP